MSEEDRTSEVLSLRDFIIEELRAELVGPRPGLPAIQTGIGQDSIEGEEILRQEDPPRIRYGAGVLFPRQSPVPDQEQADAPDPSADEPESDADPTDMPGSPDQTNRGPGDDGETEQEINRANEYLPSAMGLTALIRLPEALIVEVRAARYVQVLLRTWVDRRGETREYHGWRRIPIQHRVEIPRTHLAEEGVREWPVPTGDDHVPMRLHTFVRPPGLFGTPLDSRMITFTLLNETPGGGRSNEECFFQCSFEVRDGDRTPCFLEYPDRPIPGHAGRTESDSAALSRRERDALRLLYRRRRVFAVGHGCAPEWRSSHTGSTDLVRTETVPTYEVPPVLPASLPEFELRMDPLSRDSELAIQTGEELCRSYSEWIEELEETLKGRKEIPQDLTDAAVRNIERARICLARMQDGVDLLRERGEAREAFALMNRAMLMQQVHYWKSANPREWIEVDGQLVLEEEFTPPVYEGANNRWRPFQFAFVMMNLRAFIDPGHSDRQVVDVIWFPTGGGKTEAYLALTAFAILLRRFLDPTAAGTVTLTRYTLRLLTTQQYQRAASLICALELLRRQSPNTLGDDRITIGLWVGKGVTPNNEADAIATLNRMLREGGSENRFVLLSCPWCGAGMGAYEVGRSFQVKGYRQLTAPRRVRHACGDPHCEFTEENGGLPVLVTDEAIYADPPTMVVGTVDKFALLPWYPSSSALFGIVDGERVNPPPDLIIQDELHLISGPLGSMTGHYETAIGELCSGEGGWPVKVVASTATIARAPEQLLALYAQRSSFLFPPQGLEWGSTFFSEERPDLPGRCYVGVFATALPSQQTAMVRVLTSLIQSPLLSHDPDPVLLDCYWTLIAYFNSIRELGSAATLVSADIQEYLRVVHRRLGLTAEWPRPPESSDRRRWLNRGSLELTSRVPSGKITATLKSLFDSFDGEPGSAVDVCLATSMIQVGLDVPRLGLMAVAGQPKTTSEYIQATSRVGRESPGLVVVLLNPSKPRDRSHYEHFRSFHERIYSLVEPTSVTPFSIPVRERALHALLVTFLRFLGDQALRRRPDAPIPGQLVSEIKETILRRVEIVDPDEVAATERYLDHVLGRWKGWPPPRYGDFRPPDEEVPLMYPYGTERLPAWGGQSRQPPWATPSSMRNVDATCGLGLIDNYNPPT